LRRKALTFTSAMLGKGTNMKTQTVSIKQQGKEAVSEAASAFLSSLKFVGSATRTGFDALNSDTKLAKPRKTSKK